MDIRDLIARLASSGFADLGGAELSATVPVSDRFLTELARSFLPPAAAVRDVEVVALSGDRLRVRGRLAAASFLPPVGLTASIAQQPLFPARPTLVLQLGSGGAMLSRIGGALGFLRDLPPGVQLDGELLAIDLAEMLARQGQLRLLPLVERLQVTTQEGKLVVHFVARIPQTPDR